MHLVIPAAEHLESYRDALARGWSPDTRRPEAAAEELARVNEDAARFLAEQDDMTASGPPIHLPDGTAVPRLPGYRRWLWDGAFAGVISFRWQPGGESLPAYCLGHVGYSVVAQLLLLKMIKLKTLLKMSVMNILKRLGMLLISMSQTLELEHTKFFNNN